MAIGLNALLLGGECFVLDRVELSKTVVNAINTGDQSSTANYGAPISANMFQNSGYQYSSVPGTTQTVRGRMFKPREWMPWSLLAAGLIIVMYTSSLARQTA
jgi:hypothetical protein